MKQYIWFVFDVLENSDSCWFTLILIFRKHIPGENSFAAHPFGVPVASSSSSYVGHRGSTSCCIKTKSRSLGSASSERKMDTAGGSARLSEKIGVDEVKEFPVKGYSKEQQSGILASEFVGESADLVKVIETVPEETSHNKSQGHDDGLPLQYADLFVLSVGKIDSRTAYHCVNQIWPVGFKSCWHDKITGSLFVSDVLDGGDSGPVFRVQRLSCSKFPTLMASTLLSDTKYAHSNCGSKIDGGANSNNCNNYVEDDSIVSMLADPSLPMTDDLSSLLASGSDEYLNSQMSNCMQHKASPFKEKSQNLLSDSSVLREIGEILVEESSSLLAWKTMATKLLDSCREIIFQTGALKFMCQHAIDRSSSACSDVVRQNTVGSYDSLAKFYGSSENVNIPSVIWSSRQFEILSAELVEWLGKDRFGLDMEYVQGVVEQLPGVLSCSHYIFLNQRGSDSSSMMVQDRCLNVNVVGEAEPGKYRCGLFRGCRKVTQMIKSSMDDLCLPPGRPISTKLPPNLVDSVFQVWEFLWRFSEVLGLETPLPYKKLEEELIGALPTRLASLTYKKCFSSSLSKIHISLLQVVVGELQMKVSKLVDPYHGKGDLKLKGSRKRDGDCWISAEVAKLGILPLNELTWPEMARRFALVFLCMDGNLSPSKMTSHRSSMIVRCLQGDGGVLCGSLSGVAGIQVDVLLLAEATKKIFNCLSRDHDMLAIDDEDCDGNSSCENLALEVGVPKWAQVLEPVKKLPTNVGARIRNCVKEALEKGPPEWAKKTLEHSISKEVYKGNASGPTKRAVLSVLQQVCGEGSQHKLVTKKRRKKYVSISSIIMKQCRIVLREAAASDERRVFCNLLGRKLNERKDDEGILGSRAIVANPLDFRTIDLRLIAGAYDGSHEAFLEDVRQLWMNIRNAFGNQPDLVQLAESLSSDFESLYERKVNAVYRELVGYSKLDALSAEATKKIENFIASASEIPRAPWEEGVCRICGIDRDDDSVLLCDKCDAEYHMYCLNPPLARIPEGNWYCPSCIACKNMVEDARAEPWITCQQEKSYHGKFSGSLLDMVARLSSTMKGREYWELSVDERTLLLKFLCDEVLDSTLIRQHLERCGEASKDLQRKFRHLSTEVKALKQKEEILAAKVGRASGNLQKFGGDVTKDEESVTVLSNNDKCDGEQHMLSDRRNDTKPLSDGTLHLEGDRKWSNFNIITRQSPVSSSEEMYSVNDQVLEAVDDAIALSGDSQLSVNYASLVSSSLQDISALGGEKNFQDGICRRVEKGISNLPFPQDLHGLNAPTQTSGSPLDNSLVPMNATKEQSEDLEFDSDRNEILLLQNSIKDVEMQLEKLSLRRKFLGSDSAGRFYWIMVSPGLQPSIIVNENKLLQGGKISFQGPEDLCSIRESTSCERKTRGSSEGSNAPCPFAHEFSSDDSISSSWSCYQSDAEIERIVDFLKDDDPRERQLRESIWDWQKLRSQGSQQSENQHHKETHLSLLSIDDVLASDCLMTKAASKLKVEYGYCVEPVPKSSFKGHMRKGNAVFDDRMYRCDCLEPVWPSRHHCSSCHRTFSTKVDFKVHSCSKCRGSLGAPEKKVEIGDALKGKGLMNFGTVQEDFKGKGISIAPGSEPKYSSSLAQNQSEGLVFPFTLEDICSKLVIKSCNKELVKEIGLLGSNGIPSFVSSVSPYLSDPTLKLDYPQEDARCHALENQADQKADNLAIENSEPKDESLISHNRPQIDVRHYCVIPESSLRPLVGNAYQIFRRLKINLFDMEAALPEAALRSSKVHVERRWAWRDHVKSARTIYEMVQALIVLEESIKPECLSNTWFYWSSLSAAAQISTLSSLSLRLYSLDAAIKYGETCSKQLDGKLQKQQEQSSWDSTEKYNKGRKLNKKRKEMEA